MAIVTSNIDSKISFSAKKAQPLDIREKRYRRAMVLKEELKLTNEERYELALMLPRVDKDGTGSWKELDSDQLHDLLCMLEGYIYITYMMGQRT